MENKIKKLEEEKKRLLKARAVASVPFDKRLDEINHLLYLEKLNAAEEMVGKCFVFRNCYSCPQSNDDYWNTYFKIEALHRTANDDDYNHFCVLQIQKDCHGQIEIRQVCEDINYNRLKNNPQYKVIDPKEFDKQFNTLLQEITKVGK